ncbi:hypothetical protein SPRG_22091 [Saprolegnia parasitica CBS 223.65]|uniref:Uncharacterized protein n=1 Tax=Saprolegnia parasitica (strain CBS 223.65) TaxID=695850 RepID=A0A067D4F1_SAPPC|nr:hypothetical protein SPRG_22091 [Saprolegnia parasitica CBS 223.65]KDO33596.1 hypothetical protein SPRG_22091 [Saprolegnia parasitica CBS 223.65]|eukprot:XP_012195769.1 hypothetical protein SPRG_22091 [Saprolegnia parasitica CBS 223.65]
MDDEMVAAKLVEARARYEARDDDGAIALWRSLLKTAYATQHHALMFVVSKNLGDAVLDLGEATAFYEYALEVATTCGVMSDASLRSAVAAIAVAMQSMQVLACPLCGSAQRFHGRCHRCAATDACATCTQSFATSELVLDPNDSNVYCQPCYNAYYNDDDDDDDDQDHDNEDHDDMLVDVHVPTSVSLCTACKTGKATIRDWQGSFYCQSCFIALTQAKLARDLEVVDEPSPKAASPKAATPKAPAPDAHTPQAPASEPRTIPEPVADVDEAPVARRTYDRKFLLSFRKVHRSCPSAVRSSPVFQASTSKAAKAAPKPPTPSQPTPSCAIQDKTAMLCAALRLDPAQLNDELGLYEHYYATTPLTT